MSDSRNTAGLPRHLLRMIMKKKKNEILKVLQEKKVGLGLTTKNGDTLAHLIFQNKFCTVEDIIELLETLFDQGIDPNTENGSQETVLHLAVANKMRGIVDYLMKRKVDIYKTDEHGSSITHFFIKHEGKKFSKLIEEKDGNRIKIQHSKLEDIERESINFVEWLIGKGLNFDHKNKFKKSALDLSIEYNLHHILLVLLKHTKDVNYVTEHDSNLLHLFLRSSAAYRRDYGFTSRYAADIVKLLLDKGVPAAAVANNGDSPLRIAFEYGQEISIIEMMINHLMKTCAQNNLSTNVLVELFKSCAFWDESKAEYYLTILRSLVAEGANVNCRDKYGTTPLHWAFNAKNVCAVKFLEDHGADFSVIDEKGQNLFHELALRPYYDKSTDKEKTALFELLLSKGCCDMHGRDNDQKTPLHLSCLMHTKENLVTARKLIEHGAEINCKNKDGLTPLHYAVMDGIEHGVAMAELLLERGANVNSKDKRGDRPISYAFRSDDDEGILLRSLLLKWGACVNATQDFRNIVYDNRLSIAKEMLGHGADVNGVMKFVSLSSACKRPMRNLIFQHWYKLDTANLPCSKQYKRYMYDGEQFLNDCCIEIKQLKSTFIDNGKRTSLYAFLHMDVGSRRVHINNEKLKNLVDSPDLEQQFPQYFVLILASYRETVTWKLLLEPAKRALMELTGIFLPNICSERILAYLRNEDLLNMVECVEDDFPQ